MAVRLDKTDVVVIGLGGAGGVAVEPLTAAGLNVIGLEAGTWLAPKDFAPDELRNNYRGWPQAAQKANREIPVHRTTPARRLAACVDPPDDERRRRDDAALLGAELAPEPVGLSRRRRDRRRYGAARVPAGSTVEDWPSVSRSSSLPR